MSSNIMLKSDNNVTSDASTFYRNYWKPASPYDSQIDLLNAKQDFIYNEILKGLPEGKKVLEIGVGGEGGMIISLLPNNTVYGVDVSESAIISCRSKGLTVEKVNCDFEPLPFSDGMFDIVFVLEVFEHFSNPQFVIEQIHRVMKSEACLVVSTPTPYTYHWPRLFYPSLFEKNNFQDFLHANRFTAEFHKDPVLKNLFTLQKPDSERASWSYFWTAVKIHKNDKKLLYNIGKDLLERRDECGMRTMPVEALELLSDAIDPECTDFKLWRDYLCALFYRFINCDTEEFTFRIEWLIGLLVNSQSDVAKSIYAETLIDVHQDVGTYGFVLFDDDTEARIRQFILPAKP